MSQEDILELLEEKDIVSIKDIARELDISIVAVWYNLVELLKADEIERIIIKPEECKKYNLSPRGSKHFLWRKK